MAQVKTFTWTNPNPAVARNLDCGFDPVEVTIVNLTGGGSWSLNSGFTNGTVLDVDAGTIAGANGVTPLSQSSVYGAAISAFTNANPGVITASNIAQVGIVAGDTIKVAGVADDGSGTSLNQESTFTVASVTATAITLDQDTSAYSVWVSGGFVSRVSDSNGSAVPTENFAIRGLTLGTSAVGANSASMTAVVRGDMPVN
jgi:hypothetical protein